MQRQGKIEDELKKAKISFRNAGRCLMGNTSSWKGSESPMEMEIKFTQKSASGLNF